MNQDIVNVRKIRESRYFRGIRCLRVIFAIMVLFITGQSSAQKSDFEMVYDACLKVNDGFSDGFVNVEQINEAANTLAKLNIGKLPLNLIKGEKKSLNDHLLFDYEFINDAVKNKLVFKMAEEYARRAAHRPVDGGKGVRLKTVVIPAGKTYTYEIPNCKYQVEIGCVAETNGLFSWKITTMPDKNIENNKGKKVYRDNDDEKKGRSGRQMKVGPYDKYTIILELKNTSKNDSSFAIFAQ